MLEFFLKKSWTLSFSWKIMAEYFGQYAIPPSLLLLWGESSNQLRKGKSVSLMRQSLACITVSQWFLGLRESTPLMESLLSKFATKMLDSAFKTLWWLFANLQILISSYKKREHILNHPDKILSSVWRRSCCTCLLWRTSTWGTALKQEVRVVRLHEKHDWKERHPKADFNLFSYSNYRMFCLSAKTSA